MQSTSKRAQNGIIWSSIEKFSVQFVQFFISVIIARILSPNEFGLIAIVLAIINIFSVVNETGFGAALMQKLDRDDLDFSTVFILNVILGLLLYLIVFIVSPYIAIFFKQPQLQILIRTLGIILIINSFSVVQRTILIINVDFKSQAKASFPSNIISGIIAIIFAKAYCNAWALVIQVIISNLINTSLIWFFSKWRPHLNFSVVRIKPFFHFAYKLILARLIHTIFTQIYSIVIGRYFSTAQLGFFNRAKSIESLTSNNITAIIQRVSTPLLCEVQSDKKALGNMMIKFIVSSALIIYPLLFGLFTLANPLINILLTDKWAPAVPILRWLCPVGLLFVINTFNLNIFNATGKTGLALKNEIIKKIVCLIIIVVSIPFGFKAIIISQLITSLVELIINSYFTNKQIGINLFQQLWSLKGVFLASLIMALIVFLVTSIISSNILKLLIGSILGLSVYACICWFFNVSFFKEIFISTFHKYFRKYNNL
ncbi:MAG: lipopolysaccharide biosynthesis protein [Rikenellaceae bacterium]|nr:lipopolysaccharide biosynthesis protein [Rikenellaceae bacterium]